MNNKQEKIMEKARIQIAIFNLCEAKKQKVQIKVFLKMVAIFILAIGITSSLVYSGVVVCDKIWKEPESYQMEKELSKEEKAKCISEEEAEKIGNAYLQKIGITDESIQNLGLTKEFFSKENVWRMESKKASIKIKADTGSILSVQIPTWEYKIPYNFGITREEARNVAEQLLEKYKPEDEKGEYVLVSLKRNAEIDEEAYIWYATFYKKYDDLLNENELIDIGWIPTINGLYSLEFKRDLYENNEEKISKEEAIKIAEKKEKQIEKDRTIKETVAEIRIKQMNEEVYLRENFKEDYEKSILNLEKVGENIYQYKEDAIFYKTEERVRKVWCVVIMYEMNPQESIINYTYYIDSTTGEIIGGQRGNDLEAEKMLQEDSNNVIESYNSQLVF